MSFFCGSMLAESNIPHPLFQMINMVCSAALSANAHCAELVKSCFTSSLEFMYTSTFKLAAFLFGVVSVYVVNHMKLHKNTSNRATITSPSVRIIYEIKIRLSLGLFARMRPADCD